MSQLKQQVSGKLNHLQQVYYKHSWAGQVVVIHCKKKDLLSSYKTKHNSGSMVALLLALPRCSSSRHLAGWMTSFFSRNGVVVITLQIIFSH